MIGLSQLGKSFGGRTLFEGVSLQLHAGRCYGLVGANGAGKTTLLKMLADDEQASEGSITFQRGARIGVLRQDRFLDDEEPVLDAAMMGAVEAFAALRARDRALASPDTSAAALAEAEEAVGRTDGYTLPARAGAILEGLGIPSSVHARRLGALSGGYKLRVLLAQVLVAQPDVLLLDEPTNHLDILTIRWLERFLATFPGCAIVISHDRRFLDNVVTDILDLDFETLTPYVGGFTGFLVEKEARRERLVAERERRVDEIARKQEFIDRFGAKATKARQAQSRAKQIEKLEAGLTDIADTSRRAPTFGFSLLRPSGKEVLELEGVSKAFGDKSVLRNVSLLVRRGERVAVIGKNGVGKSTLVRIAAGGLAADAGKVRWGHEAQIGLFAQDHREILVDESQTPLQYLWALASDKPESFVRGQLGKMLFTKDDVHKRIGALSGGECARVVFAGLTVRQPNVLLLDEPTNHLDLESVDALADALKRYEGTILFVSHDRWFVAQLATRIVEITDAGVRDFPGTYDAYLAACGDDHLDATVAATLQRQERAKAEVTNAGALSWEDQKRKKSQRNQLSRRRDELLRAIEQGEARLSLIRAGWVAEGFFTATPAEEIRKLQEEESVLATKVDALVHEWESVESALAAEAS